VRLVGYASATSRVDPTRNSSPAASFMRDGSRPRLLAARVGETPHEEHEAAGVIPDEEQERMVGLNSTGAGPPGWAPAPSSRPHWPGGLRPFSSTLTNAPRPRRGLRDLQVGGSRQENPRHLLRQVPAKPARDSAPGTADARPRTARSCGTRRRTPCRTLLKHEPDLLGMARGRRLMCRSREHAQPLRRARGFFPSRDPFPS